MEEQIARRDDPRRDAAISAAISMVQLSAWTCTPAPAAWLFALETRKRPLEEISPERGPRRSAARPGGRRRGGAQRRWPSRTAGDRGSDGSGRTAPRRSGSASWRGPPRRFALDALGAELVAGIVLGVHPPLLDVPFHDRERIPAPGTPGKSRPLRHDLLHRFRRTLRRS